MSDNLIKLFLKNKEFYMICGATLFSLILISLKPSSEKQVPKTTRTSRQGIDTVIPKGFSLVPVEIANYEILDSLLGPFGVVDLYTHTLNGKEKSKRIAYRVKIVRAPRNPSHFALLVPFQKVDKILKYPGPFMASIQNPKSGGTVFEKERIRKPSRITYNTED